jgi:hypothetical protein
MESRKDIGDVVMDAVKEALQDRIGEEALRRINPKHVRKKLSKRLFELLFYELLVTGQLKFPPGLGSMRALGVKKKTVKVFDRKRKVMVERPVRAKRICYIPGDTVKEFL